MRTWGSLSWMALLLLTLLACLSPVTSAWVWQRGFPPNENWSCELGCPADKNATARIFGMIRHALYTESREVFLNFDNSWIDTLLRVKSKVRVYGVPRNELSKYTPLTSNAPDYERDEVFQIIFSPPPTNGPYRPLSFTEGEVIDNFLTRNPCWIPIHDPPVALPNEPVETTTHHAGAYDYSAIFVRMPSYWLHSTCQLYSAINKRQFPEKCPTPADISKVRSYWVGNIGWANCVHPILDHLRESLLAGNLFINPRAYDSGAPNHTVFANGKNHSIRGHWTWASDKECDTLTYAFNPWHCHFLSLSNCNTPELRDVVPFKDNWSYDQQERDAFSKGEFFKELEAIKGTREKYGDAPRLGNEWAEARMLAFVMRPNIAMRYRLRRTLQSTLVFLKPGSSLAPMFDPTNAAATQQHVHTHMSAHHALEPRLGIHVRDGDSHNDARASMPIDRSFAAHMKCAEQLASRLGVRNIYLATDNVTLFTLAPQMYPQFGWFAQQRSLKLFDGKSFEGYFNEKSVHQDVANMIVDLIFMSRSQGLIGSQDGGFYVLFTQYLCLRNKQGYCPPTYSIQDCETGPKLEER